VKEGAFEDDTFQILLARLGSPAAIDALNRSPDYCRWCCYQRRRC
jgi:hypothetical protein